MRNESARLSSMTNPTIRRFESFRLSQLIFRKRFRRFQTSTTARRIRTALMRRVEQLGQLAEEEISEVVGSNPTPPHLYFYC